MKNTTFPIVATFCVIGLNGCKQDSTTATPATTPPANTAVDDEGHDHAQGEHDHSVIGHGHAAGPHDGTIVDWGGGKYHVEFTVDHDKSQATVYVLGSDEKTPTPIDAESIELSISDPQMLVTLEAAPQEADPAGKASRYIGTHEKLGIVQEYAGTMTGVIEGTPYSGDFKEEAHDH